MCGIAGVISRNPRPIEEAVRLAMRAMIHRGPDDEGYEQFLLTSEPSGPVCGLGFRRLSIMDLSPLGHQPMIDRGSGNAIVFNGEIYNFASLRSQLIAHGHRFNSSGDTEVLLRALSQWGENALHKLDGMFALAFYEAASRRVLLARDPLGIKPLYIARSEDGIVFASEVRAVLATRMVPPDLDPAGIATFLAYGAPQDPLTVHRHVRSLPAANFEWIDAKSLAAPSRLRRYWSLPSSMNEVDSRTAVRRTRELLSDAVRKQCVSDVPLGVFLSGGIDSAAIAALSRERGAAPMTFAVGYEVAAVNDETAAAAETAEYIGTHHFQTIVGDDWVVLQLYEWLNAADRPSIDGLNTYIVSGAVKDRDVSVALSGLGGDELFGGYSSFRRIPRLQRLLSQMKWMPSRVRRAAAKILFAPLPFHTRAKAVDLVSRGLSTVELAALGRRLHDDSTLHHLGFIANRLGLSPEYLPPDAYQPLDLACHDSFRAVSEAEASLYMGNTLLRDSDVNSMAHSLEIRVPFLGQRVVDYVCGLPGSIRAPRGSTQKHLLREAVSDILPQSVFDRPKAGFSLPFRNWLFGPLKEQCETAVDALANCALFEGKAVRRRWREYEARPEAIHWSRPLSFVVLGSYLHRHGNVSSEVSSPQPTT